MSQPRKALPVALVVVLAIVVIGVLSSVVLRPALTGPITSLSFHQSKSVPDYDGSTYEITNKADLAEFAALFERHNVVPEVVSLSNIGGDCAGGTLTNAEITFASGRVATLRFYRCGENDGPYSGFIDDADELLGSWKR